MDLGIGSAEKMKRGNRLIGSRDPWIQASEDVGIGKTTQIGVLLDAGSGPGMT
jgi:hypothetical protein